MKLKYNKVVTYNLMQNSRVVYTGTTNNPGERYWEHREDGKRFDRLQITSHPLNRQKAESKETGDLIRHKRKYGRKPSYNRTWNGKFNSWR